MSDAKLQGKNIRQPLVTEKPPEKKIRPQLGKQKVMDVSDYVAAYPNKKLALVNDLDGEVQRWIAAGADPVPRAETKTRHFEGITDKFNSNWVTFPGGTDEAGKVFEVYLMMMDPEDYYYYKQAPKEERQAAIRQALTRGANQSEENGSLPGGGSIQTYAPNLIDGESRGYNEIR